METFSALVALCAGNSSVTDEFPSQRPVTWSFYIFFYLRLNKWLNKQSWGWWFETPSRPLWCHCNDQIHCIADHVHVTSLHIRFIEEGLRKGYWVIHPLSKRMKNWFVHDMHSLWEDWLCFISDSLHFAMTVTSHVTQPGHWTHAMIQYRVKLRMSKSKNRWILG